MSERTLIKVSSPISLKVLAMISKRQDTGTRYGPDLGLVHVCRDGSVEATNGFLYGIMPECHSADIDCWLELQPGSVNHKSKELELAIMPGVDYSLGIDAGSPNAKVGICKEGINWPPRHKCIPVMPLPPYEASRSMGPCTAWVQVEIGKMTNGESSAIWMEEKGGSESKLRVLLHACRGLAVLGMPVAATDITAELSGVIEDLYKIRLDGGGGSEQ